MSRGGQRQGHLHRVRRTIAGLILLLFMVNAVWSKDASVRSIHLAYVNYPPYYGADLSDGGPLGQIIREAFTLAGYQVTREQLPWARAFQWTQEGRYDALYSAWYRQEREQWFAYSEALPANEVVFFGRKATLAKYRESGSLAGLTLGVVRGYALPASLNADALTLQRVTSDRQNIEKLVKGYIDLTIVDKALARYIISESFSEQVDEFAAHEPPLQREPQYLIFSRKSVDFEQKLKDFNRAYRALQQSGRVKEILQLHGLDE